MTTTTEPGTSARNTGPVTVQPPVANLIHQAVVSRPGDGKGKLRIASHHVHSVYHSHDYVAGFDGGSRCSAAQSRNTSAYQIQEYRLTFPQYGRAIDPPPSGFFVREMEPILSRSGSNELALNRALKAADIPPRDGAGVELCRRYARLLDASDGDFETYKDIGPRYLAALAAVGLTLSGRSAKSEGGTAGAGTSPLDELRKRRERRAGTG